MELVKRAESLERQLHQSESTLKEWKADNVANLIQSPLLSKGPFYNNQVSLSKNDLASSMNLLSPVQLRPAKSAATRPKSSLELSRVSHKLRHVLGTITLHKHAQTLHVVQG